MRLIDFFFVLILIISYLNSSQSSKLNIFDRVKCLFYECCQQPYLKKDFAQLEQNIKKNLHGQPLVQKTLLSAIKGHYLIAEPSKALVLSFHGPTGVGKTLVSSFIANSLFQKGIKSRYYKQFIATKDFPHNEKTNEYKEIIKQAIESTVKQCEYSLFVFDETDKIPMGLVDVLKAYIDFNKEVDGVNYRKSVFIFLSNSGSNKLAELTLELDKKNLKRDMFEIKPFHNAIQNHIFYLKSENDKGMRHATIIEGYLIDFYIPFLPLERVHVKMCIRDELKKYKFVDQDTYLKKHLENDVDLIANEMIYEPVGLNKFSSSGCKRVPNLVRNLIVEKQYLLKDEL